MLNKLYITAQSPSTSWRPYNISAPHTRTFKCQSDKNLVHHRGARSPPTKQPTHTHAPATIHKSESIAGVSGATTSRICLLAEHEKCGCEARMFIQIEVLNQLYGLRRGRFFVRLGGERICMHRGSIVTTSIFGALFESHQFDQHTNHHVHMLELMRQYFRFRPTPFRKKNHPTLSPYYALQSLTIFLTSYEHVNAVTVRVCIQDVCCWADGLVLGFWMERCDGVLQ